jgi:hypothetical protein
VLHRADADLTAKLVGISIQEWSQDAGEHSIVPFAVRGGEGFL